MNRSKILIVGSINEFCLETSYANAGAGLGYDIIRFDPDEETKKHIKFSMLGRKIHDFLHVQTWTRKMNRELIVLAKAAHPAYIFVFGNARILYGTLVTIKLILPECKLIWVWPDTPMNLDMNNLGNAKIFDLSATYSFSSVALFSRLGFNNTHWIPLAGDTLLHRNEINTGNIYNCDISFVGMWRPEREKVMKSIVNNFPGLKIEIHGNYWQRDCTDKQLLKKWKGSGFYARDLANYFNASKINVNIIDDTNYPAANMRFFEIPTAGGLQLTSSCPEFENIFLNKESVIYFKNDEEMIENIHWALNNESEVLRIRRHGQRLIEEKHNYQRRISDILKLID